MSTAVAEPRKGTEMTVHTGEAAPRTATMHCDACGAVVEVRQGETVPTCPDGHTSFAEGVGAQRGASNPREGLSHTDPAEGPRDWPE